MWPKNKPKKKDLSCKIVYYEEVLTAGKASRLGGRMVLKLQEDKLFL